MRCPELPLGLFIPTTTPLGDVWHATNQSGGWNVTPRSSNNVPFSMSLVLAYKLASINPSAFEAGKSILDAVPYDYSHSPNTGEPFSCRVWVKDALAELHKNPIFMLTREFSLIKSELVDRANFPKDEVKGGTGNAEVENYGMN
ncbi:hypothetical protein N7471_006383 [Penicillium samsonianum]|uniref:uncharacterized protein n=1 Tax=Penicillium samsonianum TaxID=1882272 RepID=UPI0025489AAB|nr:uncharacterized protein N7471_006383 [Penicillium samsonianum]KAJ6139897.1 hypothetical protein N7471_006383 [Penicillium samsonianum]